MHNKGVSKMYPLVNFYVMLVSAIICLVFVQHNRIGTLRMRSLAIH